MVVKKGDKFLCHTNLIMNGSKRIEATKGKYYYSEIDGCITNNSRDKKHSFPNYSKWFTKIEEPKELIIEIW